MVDGSYHTGDELIRKRASRRNVLRAAGTTGLAVAGVRGLSGRGAAEEVTVNQRKTSSDTFEDMFYRPTSTVYDGATSMTVNKREYEDANSTVTYRFDLTGTFEAITNDDEGFTDSFGFRIDFDEFDSPATEDLHDNPGSDGRVKSGVDLTSGDYDASDSIEEAIEFTIEELVDAAAWVSTRAFTVGSLLWALYQGVDSSVSNHDAEVEFSEFKEKEVNLGYYGLEINIADPSQTAGVTFEMFNQTVGFEHSVSEHFDLNDH